MAYPRKRLLLLLPLAVSACSEGIAGEYKCENVGLLDTIELTSDNKLYVSATAFGQTRRKAGTYEVDGDKVVGMVDGQSTVFSREDDDLTYGPGRCVRV